MPQPQGIAAAEIVLVLERSVLSLAGGDTGPFEHLVDESSVEFTEGQLSPLTVDGMRRRLASGGYPSAAVRVKSANLWVAPEILIVDLEFQAAGRSESWTAVIVVQKDRWVVRHLNTGRASIIDPLRQTSRGWGS